MSDVKEIIRAQFPYKSYFERTLKLSNHGHTSTNLLAHCPFHPDKKPSFTVCYSGEKKGVVRCLSSKCGFSGDIFTFIQELQSVNFKEALAIAAKEAGIDTNDFKEKRNKKSDSELPEIKKGYYAYPHQDLFEKPELKKQLTFLNGKRGLTEHSIKRWKIGYTDSYGGRFIIPIFGPNNELWTLRKYSNKGKGNKFINHTYKDEKGMKHSYKKPHHCFTDWQFLKESNGIIICAGELDAILLIQNGFCAFTELAGEGSWSGLNNYHFKDKYIVIAYDNDESGRNGAIKVLESIKNIAQAVSILELPDEVGIGGDITDYFVALEKTPDDLRELIAKLKPQAEKKQQMNEASENKQVSLYDSLRDPRYHNKIINIPIRVNAVAQEPFTGSLRARLGCSYNVNCSFKATCPVLIEHNGLLEIDLVKDSKAFMNYMSYAKSDIDRIFKRDLNIKKGCKESLKFSEEVFSALELQVAPRIMTGKISVAEDSNVTGTVYYIGSEKIRENSNYTFIGKPVENPRSHKTVIVAHSAIPELNDIDSFEIDSETLALLETFRKPKDCSVYEHIEHIAEDWSVNICGMIGTLNTAYASMLTIFSPLNFEFNGEYVHRGWANTLLIGDTGTGKSIAIERFNSEFNCAEIVTGENISTAGLIGGMLKGDKAMLFRQGILSRNDRRALCIDEFKEMSKEVKTSMRSARSEGIGRYAKIEQRTMYARTRLLMYTSPKGAANTLESYSPPIKAALAVYDGSREDIRRTDYIICLHKDDVPPEKINSLKKEVVEHKFTKIPTQKLILHCWNRTADNLWFDPSAIELILKEVLRLGDKYTDTIPLVDAKSHRFKIAKGAVTFAQLCFSTNQKSIERYVNGDLKYFKPGELLEVFPEHVSGFLKWFEGHMDSDNVGLLELSLQEKRKGKAVDSGADLDKLFESVFPKLKMRYAKFKEILFTQNIKNLYSLQIMFCPQDIRLAMELIGFLAEKNIIKISDDGRYIKYNPSLLSKFRTKLEEYYEKNFEETMSREANYEDNLPIKKHSGTSNYQDDTDKSETYAESLFNPEEKDEEKEERESVF